MNTSEPKNDVPGRSWEDGPEPQWLPVANVKLVTFRGPKQKARSGLKHFSGGSKLHVLSLGVNCQRAYVVGKHRRSKRWLVIWIATEHLQNWRVQLVRSPGLLRKIGPNPTWGSRDKAEEAVTLITMSPEERQQHYTQLRRNHKRQGRATYTGYNKAVNGSFLWRKLLEFLRRMS